MRTGSGNSIYFHRNQQYSITALTNGSGTITERYAYAAYGAPIILSSNLSTLVASTERNRYAYTGREYDETSDLYHYRARLYDSVAGRFCARDPIGFAGSRWSLYEYVSGKPFKAVDPNGEDIILLHPDSIGHANVSQYPETPDEIVIYSHNCLRRGIGIDTGCEQQTDTTPEHCITEPLEFEVLIQRILTDPEYKPGIRIRLVWCCTAKTDTPKRVANRLKCMVISYKPVVFFGPGTWVGPDPKNPKEPDLWNRTKPEPQYTNPDCPRGSFWNGKECESNWFPNVIPLPY
jgi:RHS repeat-associated protein